MNVCRNEEMNKGGPYPKSCPICKFGPVCARNVPLDTSENYQQYGYMTKEQYEVRDQYAVIYTDTIYHEGDERSRTNPGHGYPAYSESVEKIKIFPHEDALKEWIRTRNSYEKYTAIKFQKLSVRTEIVVGLG